MASGEAKGVWGISPVPDVMMTKPEMSFGGKESATPLKLMHEKVIWPRGSTRAYPPLEKYPEIITNYDDEQVIINPLYTIFTRSYTEILVLQTFIVVYYVSLLLEQPGM